MNRLTLFGGIFLAIIAIIPIIVGNFISGVNMQFGGTSLLIVVDKILFWLAKEVKHNSDYTEYTIELNKDIKWHDDKDFSAEDVKFKIGRAHV